jgi:hypothetical protein
MSMLLASSAGLFLDGCGPADAGARERMQLQSMVQPDHQQPQRKLRTPFRSLVLHIADVGLPKRGTPMGTKQAACHLGDLP